MLVKYRIRHFIDAFKCIETIKTCYLYKSWTNGGLLYGYVDRFQIKTFAIEDIIECVEA